jgi:hypothetical protein
MDEMKVWMLSTHGPDPGTEIAELMVASRAEMKTLADELNSRMGDSDWGFEFSEAGDPQTLDAWVLEHYWFFDLEDGDENGAAVATTELRMRAKG